MGNISGNKSEKKKGSSENPFVKMIDDKKRIAEAIRKGEDLSKLKNINLYSHYKLTQTDQGYHFITDQNIKYHVFFTMYYLDDAYGVNECL